MRSLQPIFSFKLADRARAAQPVHNRHADIHQDEVERARRRRRGQGFGFVRLEGFESVDGFGVAQRLPLCEHDEQFQVDCVVVDEQDARVEVLACVGGAGGGRCDGLRGRDGGGEGEEGRGRGAAEEGGGCLLNGAGGLHRDAVADAALFFGERAGRCEELVLVQAQRRHRARDVAF